MMRWPGLEPGRSELRSDPVPASSLRRICVNGVVVCVVRVTVLEAEGLCRGLCLEAERRLRGRRRWGRRSRRTGRREWVQGTVALAVVATAE